MTAESQQAANGAASASTAAAETVHYGHGHHSDSKLKLAVGAVGVVFGDIGTSPLYAFRETFAGHHSIEADRLHIYGVLSLVFWSMMLVVTFKYVLTIMRADNKGEGGSLALLALISRQSEGKRWTWPIVLLGVFATALFYGDSMITPAMSVLSATEGLQYVSRGFEPYIVPIALAILIGLFAIQSRDGEGRGAVRADHDALFHDAGGAGDHAYPRPPVDHHAHAQSGQRAALFLL
jgi:KUP system potassium uptake protein